MAFSVAAKLEGLGPALGRLEKLRRGARGKILRKALNEGTKPVLSSAKGLAPRESGQLRKSLGKKVKVYRESGAAVGLVGPRSGFKRQVTVEKRKVSAVIGGKRTTRRIGAVVYRNPVRYAHLVELGRKAVSVKNKKALVSAGGTFYGRTVAAALPRPFLGRAWARSVGTASEKVRSTLEREIAREVAGA